MFLKCPHSFLRILHEVSLCRQPKIVGSSPGSEVSSSSGSLMAQQLQSMGAYTPAPKSSSEQELANLTSQLLLNMEKVVSEPEFAGKYSSFLITSMCLSSMTMLDNSHIPSNRFSQHIYIYKEVNASTETLN